MPLPSLERSDHEGFLRQLSGQWMEKIDLAIQHRKPFTDVAQQCMMFFAGPAHAMWKPEYQRKYLGKELQGGFQIGINKAFELVALFGPTLYHQNPQRTVSPYRPIEFGPEHFAALDDPQIAQQAMQIYQQAMQQTQKKSAKDDLRAKVMQKYLSYTPREQPGGGLERHATSAITEALLKGRGCLWVEPFQMPASDRKLTGCFHDRVENLVIDPDVRSNSLDDATWIARKYVHATDKVEREYKLPKGSLKKQGNMESAEGQARRRTDPLGNFHQQKGETQDLITYWKVWSRMGVGTRLSGVRKEWETAFDDVVGDFAHIVVAPDVPWPLNAHKDRQWDASDDEVKQMFGWPVPYWQDRRWPVTVLDFYPHPDRIWPISPLGPGLGELTAMNIILSRLVQRIYSGSRDFLGVPESVKREVTDIVENSVKDISVIGIPNMQKSIKDMLQFIQHPPVNFDVWRIMDALMEMFDKRTGLTELWYSMNPGGATSRTATDVQAKQEKASIRPDDMSNKVTAWLSEAADMEKLCAYWSGVEGRDLNHLLGDVGAFFWDQLVTQEDPEVVARQMTATVESDSSRRPNRERDIENLQRYQQAFGGIDKMYLQATGDVGPINAAKQIFFKKMQMSSEGLMFQPPPPPPEPPDPTQDPEFQKAQLEMQLEQQASQADLQKQQVEMQLKQLGAQAEMAQDQQEHAQEMAQDAQQHAQEMGQSQQQHALKLRQEESMGRARLKAALARRTPGNKNGAKT